MSLNAIAPTPSWTAIAGGSNTPATNNKPGANQQFANVLQATNPQTQSGGGAASLASSQHAHHHAHQAHHATPAGALPAARKPG